MNVYNIRTVYNNKCCVVADNMAEAERIFNSKYWPASILEISLHSSYVQIQGYDEQAKNDN